MPELAPKDCCANASDALGQSPNLSLRPPEVVMHLERLGSFHSTRLSFTRTLVRRMHHEQWRFEVIHNTLDEFGFGVCVYLVHTPAGPVSFVAVATELDDKDRTDRVIAEKWDMCFTLMNGIPDAGDLGRLCQQLPLQEAGRLSDREMVMSRANKSMRLFNSVVEHLASGHQPNPHDIMDVGYLVRTTAVYGNGKFGVMDFDQVKQSTPFGLPFQAEMLTVYMARQFSIDLVEHVARQRGGESAVALPRPIKRAIGVGNATGLGMAPFLVGHPQLIGQWIKLRETAILRVLSKCNVSPQCVEQFRSLIERVKQHLAQWVTPDPRQSERLAVLKIELQGVEEKLSQLDDISSCWYQLAEWARLHASYECQELLHSLFLEIYPDDLNDLEQLMGVDEYQHLDPSMHISKLRRHIEIRYQWALQLDYDAPESQHYFWYVSQEKEEPRLGQRYLEPGSELEMRVGIGRDVKALYATLCQLAGQDCTLTIADLLRCNPEHRYIVSRIQSLVDFEYGEIQENLLGENCLPIDILRCKLAIFGATRFDPKSNLWTRITLFQGAPLSDELDLKTADDWAFPVFPGIDQYS